MQVLIKQKINFLKKHFCQSNKNIKESKTEENNSIQDKKTYRYNDDKFDLVNSPSFLQKIQRMELMNKPRMRMLESYKFPLLLAGSSLFIYHLWQQMPYGLIFGHTTISENILRENYYHALFIAPLSLQTTGHFLTYWPLLCLSLVLCGKYMKTKHMMLLYTSTAFISAGTTYIYEKRKNSKLGLNMISPKCIGAVTPLSFASAFFAINPNYILLNQRMLPFFIIPALYCMYEIQEIQNGYVNELCRPAHISSIVWGLVFGLVFKRYVLKGIV